MVTAWRRSTVGELSWCGAAGPAGLAVVPLVHDGVPCAALPFSHADVAADLRGRHVAFSVSDTVAGRQHGIVGTGEVDVHFDTDGTRFVESLLEQELVKHPPTRLRADSMLARRENWWWIPRIVVTLCTDPAVRPLPGRTRANDALLVRADGDGHPLLDVVSAPSWPAAAGSAITLYARDGSLLDSGTGPALAYGHAHSPDFERWQRWHRCGVRHDDVLHVDGAEGEPAAALPPFRLLERLVNHRQTARACKAGIAAAGS